MVSTVRNHLGPKIFGVLTAEERLKHLKFDTTLEKYPLFPPMTFPDGIRDKNKILMCTSIARVSSISDLSCTFSISVLRQILRALLFGPRSADHIEFKKIPNGPMTQGKLWGITEVTAGSIAIAIILVGIGFNFP